MGQSHRIADQNFVTEHQPPFGRPVFEETVQLGQIIDRRHEGSAALLGGLNSMSLQFILPDTIGALGEIGLHRTNPRRPHFDGFFNNKCGAFLADRREQKPQIRRILLGVRLGRTQENPTLLARFHNFGIPLTIGPVDERQHSAFLQSHHPKQVMRLLPRQRNRLPYP